MILKDASLRHFLAGVGVGADDTKLVKESKDKQIQKDINNNTDHTMQRQLILVEELVTF